MSVDGVFHMALPLATAATVGPQVVAHGIAHSIGRTSRRTRVKTGCAVVKIADLGSGLRLSLTEIQISRAIRLDPVRGTIARYAG